MSDERVLIDNLTAVVAQQNIQIQSLWSELTSLTELVNKLAVLPRSYGSPVRAFNIPYQISTDQNAFVMYSINQDVTPPLLGSMDTLVRLLVDEFSPPGSQYARVKLKSTSLAGVAVPIESETEGILVGMIPANSWVMLESTGTATPSLVSQLEFLYNSPTQFGKGGDKTK